MRYIALVFSALALAGCFPTFYTPTTIEGATCKKDCGVGAQRCGGAPYTCDRAYSQCIDACKDMDRIKGGTKSK